MSCSPTWGCSCWCCAASLACVRRNRRGWWAGGVEPAAAGAGGRLSAVRRVVRAEDRGGYRVVGGRGAAWGCRYYGGCYYGGKRAGEWRIGWMEGVGGGGEWHWGNF